MSLNADYQKLEPGNEVRLFSVDGTAFGMSDVLFFHAHNIAHTPEEIEAAGGDENKLPAKPIWWQGKEYKAWPCQIEGIEASTDGSSAQPKLSVANLDSSITALCLAYDDLLQAKVTIHDTLVKYLDARNFTDGNATADPTQEKVKVFYIDAKSGETNESVEFTLSSPMDLQGLMIPTRQLHSLCTWCIRNKYRTGDGCDYAGANYFDKNNNPVSDPSLDECSGTLTACKLRFGENNELSFGGFPGTSLIRS
ncbi:MULTISPECIES: phage minor tail protein L [Enterobacter]|uniref:phage minor tail protein L n=1 Tax=Enterobacter TaxID=547 RepID=UPI002005D9D8|nr:MULTISPECIES: phage minor tail protein L [Enterobacter]MCK7390064.1 phage minor tail protein L [Enterobacter bugandensis]UXP22301.1 phage minor tail protein L [Enterobacter sp. 155105]HAS1471542.1 phage minor tail protein L [Enterobacter bugandensis]HDR2047814.1 phage minor tail protein L [Enterobacter bugandensis]